MTDTTTLNAMLATPARCELNYATDCAATNHDIDPTGYERGPQQDPLNGGRLAAAPPPATARCHRRLSAPLPWAAVRSVAPVALARAGEKIGEFPLRSSPTAALAVMGASPSRDMRRRRRPYSRRCPPRS